MNSSSKLWDQCLEQLKLNLTSQSFETWFQPTRAALINDKILKITVPSEFFKTWILDHYHVQLQQALNQVYPQQLEIQFEIPSHVESNVTEPFLPSSEPLERSKSVSLTPEKSRVDSDCILNPKFTFDSFVVGNSNRFSHAACLAVGDAPARSYNPLFIYGGVGLGKTHLLQAIGNYVQLKNPSQRILYISSERFMNDFIHSIQSGKQFDFRNKYRTVDVLLIDDIQFWEGKEATQEEFFHTFNVLYEAQKQIVATSDSHPKEIKLEARLRNRFEMGLITDIQEPDLETRIAILRKKAEHEHIVVSNEVTQFIANHVKANIRELEGSMLRVIAYASMTSQPVTLKLVQDILKDTFAREVRKISIDLIQRITAEHYNCKFSDMKSKRRTKQVAFPRQVAMYLSRELTSHSLSEIGAEFGGKDHTTIIHAYEKIDELLHQNILLQDEIDLLKARIHQTSISNA